MKYLFLPVLLISMICNIAFAGPSIHLNHSSFDPLLTTQQSHTASDEGPDGKHYYIVQFQGPIEASWKAEAEAAGAEILDYTPDFAFVVRAPQSAVEKLRAISSIRWVGDYATEYRLSPKLQKDGTAEVNIRVFPGADNFYVRKKLVEAGGSVITPQEELGHSLHASIPASKLLQAAHTAGVAWIEPKPDYKLSNNTARGIMNTGTVWTNLGLYGSGQIAAIADTGLDTGNTSTLLSDFSGRVIKTYSLGRRKNWSDPNGHGTHVAGSLLGNGALSGSNASTHQYEGSFAGVAPEASLVFQSVMDSRGYLTGIPTDLNNLFISPYNDGARIHSNSWGDSSNPGYYASDSYYTDQFIWNHKDMVILFAAGNEGVDTNPADGKVDVDSINYPATAKNIICVGATESITPASTTTWGSAGYTTEPLYSDKVANNSSGMAAFSSRGPCDDGRIKPDICAPGIFVISDHSQYPGAGTLSGSYNSYYAYGAGTSMATPLVAGACVLTREYYVKKGISSPSAALIKATLLNGAFDMAPGQYTSPQEIPARPNSVEGWGRLDLKNSLIPASPKAIYSYDVSTGLSTGGSSTYHIYNVSGASPLRVTLAWTDYPASAGASIALVNDLDLKVTTPSGVTYYGNGTIDRRNNVEGVDFTANPAVGMYTITVTGYNIPYGPQPYALIVSGAALPAQPNSTPTATAAKALPDGSLVRLQGKIVSAGTDQFNNFFYIQEPDRSSGIRVQYGLGGGPSVTAGMTVSVAGTMSTAAGQRVIKDPIVTF
ncbi:MAG: S8 family serine peptidase [Armatimonadota bacterium]